MASFESKQKPAPTEITIVGDHCALLLSSLSTLGLEHRRAGSLTQLQRVQNELENQNASMVVIVVEDQLNEAIRLLSWICQKSPMSGVVLIASDSTNWFKRACLELGILDFINVEHGTNHHQMAVRLQQSLHRFSAIERPNEKQFQLVDGVEVIGSSAAMRSVFGKIASASGTDASVFITGENGTGKDVCATLIHERSTRREHRLMSVNCAAIPHGLAESELFGHVKGSFTGAISDRLGVAKMADSGTLFLDEIAEMDLSIQGKLLRFLQSGTFSQVGSSQVETVDTRVICATNRNPEQAIEQGRFREDLFYRLNVIHIHLPPLRDRGEDILNFANSFLTDFSQREGKSFNDISPEARILLESYRWPGNVRELQNVMQSIVVLNDGELVTPSMLPSGLIKTPKNVRPHSRKQSERVYSLPALKAGAKFLLNTGSQEQTVNFGHAEILPLENVIQNAISTALDQCDGNVVEASLKLGVSASTLYRRLKA